MSYLPSLSSSSEMQHTSSSLPSSTSFDTQVLIKSIQRFSITVTTLLAINTQDNHYEPSELQKLFITQKIQLIGNNNTDRKLDQQIATSTKPAISSILKTIKTAFDNDDAKVADSAIRKAIQDIEGKPLTPLINGLKSELNDANQETFMSRIAIAITWFMLLEYVGDCVQQHMVIEPRELEQNWKANKQLFSQHTNENKLLAKITNTLDREVAEIINEISENFANANTEITQLQNRQIQQLIQQLRERDSTIANITIQRDRAIVDKDEAAKQLKLLQKQQEDAKKIILEQEAKIQQLTSELINASAQIKEQKVKIKQLTTAPTDGSSLETTSTFVSVLQNSALFKARPTQLATAKRRAPNITNANYVTVMINNPLIVEQTDKQESPPH